MTLIEIVLRTAIVLLRDIKIQIKMIYDINEVFCLLINIENFII